MAGQCIQYESQLYSLGLRVLWIWLLFSQCPLQPYISERCAGFKRKDCRWRSRYLGNACIHVFHWVQLQCCAVLSHCHGCECASKAALTHGPSRHSRRWPIFVQCLSHCLSSSIFLFRSRSPALFHTRLKKSASPWPFTLYIWHLKHLHEHVQHNCSVVAVCTSDTCGLCNCTINTYMSHHLVESETTPHAYVK